MRCPFCQAEDTKVADSRLVAEANEVRRRRVCNVCGGRFTTYESIELVMPRVVKRDQSRESFDQKKMREGILRALEKRPVSTAQVDEAIQTIMNNLRSLGEKEVPASKVGELIMDALQDLDEVAYIRFASVYRRFRDLEAFKSEIERLIAK